MVHIDIPQDVKFILEKLRVSGYEAYAVGGCVRDSLLGKTPKDWDVTTSALPEEVKNIFPRTVDTGIKHGTVTVLVNGAGYEVTTYRVDGEYLDGRHPEEVSFTASLDEDLKRRDFTINALVYNETDGIKDLFDGVKDLENGIIRCVGIPEERFGEDALRILRAVRFAAVLGFSIEPLTYEAAVKLAGNLDKVSAERIRAELEKILISTNPEHICLLNNMGISRVILRELESVSNTGPLEKALKNSPPDPFVRWSVFTYFIENACIKKEPGCIAKEIMQRLKFDNRTRDMVILFLRTVDNLPESFGKIPERALTGRRILNAVGCENVFLFLDFCTSVSNRKEDIEEYSALRTEIEGIIERKECFSLKTLAINGRDLMKEHLAEGKELGMLLDYLLDTVLIDPGKNTREHLLEVARKYGH